jgi:hypothetical protein
VRFSLDYFGALSYTVGVAMYWTAALATILNDCPNTLLATDVYVRPRPPQWPCAHAVLGCSITHHLLLMHSARVCLLQVSLQSMHSRQL